MKKSLFSLLLIFISFLVCTVNTFGLERDNIVNYAVKQSKEAVLVCEYYDSETNKNQANHNVEIYYYFNSKSSEKDTSKWIVTYRNKDDGWSTLGEDTFKNVFVSNIFGGNVYYNSVTEYFKESDESTFTCPKYAYSRDEWVYVIVHVKDVCLSETDNNPRCGNDSFKTTLYLQGELELDYSDDLRSIFTLINQYASDTVYDNITIDDVMTLGVDEYIKEKVKDYMIKYYHFDTDYDMPDFVSNYIDNDMLTTIKDISLDSYTEFQERAQAELEEKHQNEEISDDDYNTASESINESYDKAMNIGESIKLKICDDPKCYGLLGENMTKVVNNIFDFVKYAGPILVVVLTSIDLIKASVSGSQDELKKVSQDFAKRAIAAIMLFFIPLICSIVFELAGITVPENCIGQSTYESTDCDT